jgi:hypothetical protein
VEIVVLLCEGLTQKEVAERLGVTPPTVSYHLRKLGVAPRPGRSYDWTAIQRFYDSGATVRDCLERFRLSSATWHAARLRGDVVARAPKPMPVEELLAEPRNRGHLKKRLVRLGLKEPRCERCGIDSWRGRPLSLALHHRNGDGRDNRLENLELLCPNCHSQTDTFAGRNRRAGRAA